MTTAAHLWAIGYDDMGRADQVREEITRLGWDKGQAGKYLTDIRVMLYEPGNDRPDIVERQFADQGGQEEDQFAV